MTKHVFRVTSYGSIYHEGEFVKETEKTVVYRNSYKRERRIDKTSCKVVETKDVKALEMSFQKAWSDHEPEIRRLSAALLEAKKLQRDAAMKALTDGDQA